MLTGNVQSVRVGIRPLLRELDRKFRGLSSIFVTSFEDNPLLLVLRHHEIRSDVGRD
jgi:hypothetical protein